MDSWDNMGEWTQAKGSAGAFVTRLPLPSNDSYVLIADYFENLNTSVWVNWQPDQNTLLPLTEWLLTPVTESSILQMNNKWILINLILTDNAFIIINGVLEW